MSRNLIPDHFGAPDQQGKYRSFVETLIGETYETPLKAVIASTLLGTPGFVTAISEKHVGHLNADRNVPAVKQLSGKLTAEEIVEAVKRETGEEGALWKKISIHLCHHYSGMKLKEIGAKFGLSDAAVSVTSKRLPAQATKDRKTREVLEATKQLLIVET